MYLNLNVKLIALNSPYFSQYFFLHAELSDSGPKAGQVLATACLFPNVDLMVTMTMFNAMATSVGAPLSPDMSFLYHVSQQT